MRYLLYRRTLLLELPDFLGLPPALGPSRYSSLDKSACGQPEVPVLALPPLSHLALPSPSVVGWSDRSGGSILSEGGTVLDLSAPGIPGPDFRISVP